jgi:superfamily II DNA or RNA helicase
LGLIDTVLVVVPTTNLMSQWYDEFLKWNYDTSKITFMCIQSACKKEMNYDLVIVDEIHTTLSVVYSMLYARTISKQWLGLTATIPEDRSLLDSVCPIVYNKTLKEVASVGGIIADTTTFNLVVKLNRKEKAKYNTFNEQFHRATMQIAMIKKDVEHLKDKNVFDIAKEYSTKKNLVGDEVFLQKQAKAY